MGIKIGNPLRRTGQKKSRSDTHVGCEPLRWTNGGTKEPGNQDGHASRVRWYLQLWSPALLVISQSLGGSDFPDKSGRFVDAACLTR